MAGSAGTGDHGAGCVSWQWAVLIGILTTDWVAWMCVTQWLNHRVKIAEILSAGQQFTLNNGGEHERSGS